MGTSVEMSVEISEGNADRNVRSETNFGYITILQKSMENRKHVNENTVNWNHRTVKSKSAVLGSRGAGVRHAKACMCLKQMSSSFTFPYES